MPPLASVYSLLCDLPKYKKQRNVVITLCLYKCMWKYGLRAHNLIGHQIILMLLDVGHMLEAHEILKNSSFCIENFWNSLITDLVKYGELNHAIGLYIQMQEDRYLKPSLYAFSSLLKACGHTKDVKSGSAMHAEIARKWSLEKICLHSNILIDMYVRGGCLSKAQEVFDNLVVRDVVSWTSLMSGYVKHDHSEQVLQFFQEMQIQGICPNALTYVCFLKACGSLGAIEKGKELHAHLERKGLWEKEPILGNALVDMYVKCGCLTNAQQVFDRLPIRDVVTWTTLIGGYANHDFGVEALNYYGNMQGEGVTPNAHTYVCSLKACGILKDDKKGKEIHSDIIKKDLLKNEVVGSALIDMYAKCGLLAKAHEVFDQFHVQDVISWNALITGYMKHNHNKEALSCYEQMRLKGVSPNAITYITIIKACASLGAINKGEEIHAEISKKVSLERSLLVGSALVYMYTKCGLLEKAQKVFDNILERDVITSNALIAGYVDHDCNNEALVCFEKMESEGLSPDPVTFSFIFKACGGIGDSDKGREMHCEVARKGLLGKGPFLGNALIDMYVKFGLLSKAHEIFHDLQVQDVVSWTTLIAGYVEQDHGIKALDYFEQMQHEGVLPNPVTFVCILKACGIIGVIIKGQEIHAKVFKEGLIESSLVVGSAVVDMYAKCGWLKKAQEVFDALEARDIIAWNSLISGYAQQNYGSEALTYFAKMQLDGVSPNAITFICSLKACGSIRSIDMGQKIHAEIDRQGLLHDSCIGNALIDMHSKCGLLMKAQEVFDKLLVRDVVSWNSLIGGYANSEQGKAALDCLEKMQVEGVIPDAITFFSILKACGSIGAREKGEEIYAEMARKGILEQHDHIINNALVDLYAKCGPVGKAEQIFDKLPVRDVVSWNALILGYAQLGENAKALNTFNRMRDEGRTPDVVTFIGVLNACSHALLVDKGEAYFDAMSKDYDISPTLEHYTCMADLLGRTGHIDRALVLLEKMPWNADIVAWHTMLDACRKWGSVEYGKKAFERAIMLDEMDASAYLCMSGIYADAGMQEDVLKVNSLLEMRKQAQRSQ